MSTKNKQPSNANSTETLWKVLRFIGRYRLLLILSIILAAVSVVLQLYVPVLFGDAIDQVVAEHQVNFQRMWYYLSRILVMVVVSSLATWIMNIINNRMTFRTVQDIRAKAIRHIQKLPLSYLDGHSTGDIISRVIADTDILSDGLLLGFTQLFSGIVTIIGTLIFMFSKNFWITLMVIVLTPLSFFVAKFISSRSFHMFRKQSDARGRQTALIEEMIGNQKIVQAFGYEDKSSARFAEINQELKECSQKAVFYSSLTNPSTRFVNNVIYAGVALVGAFMIPGGALTVGGLSVLLSYANQYMKPFNDISSVITELQNALACATRIFALLEEEPESDTLGKNAMAYLDKIRMLCEKNHIRLLLVKAPSKSPVWYDTWESQILEYASKYDLDYINFLNLVDEIGIDYNTDTYDQGLHMNLSGAEKCADYLGKFLSETYGLKDLRSDKTICSDWENKTIFYENMKKAQYKELKKYGEIVNY